MSYYDNVKDNIRTKNKKKKEKEGDKMTGNFDSLREAAEQTEDNEEGDDTPIEVLEEDGLSTESPKKRKQKQERQRTQENNEQETNPLKNNAQNSNSSEKNVQNVNLSSIEEKMDKMIEQNDELIRILRSFTE